MTTAHVAVIKDLNIELSYNKQVQATPCVNNMKHLVVHLVHMDSYDVSLHTSWGIEQLK